MNYSKLNDPDLLHEMQKHIEIQSQKLTKVLEGNQKIAASGQEVCLELIDTLQRQMHELIVQLVALHDAADALYMAGQWSLIRTAGLPIAPESQAKLWEDLRSALGYELERPTEAADPDVAIAAGETYTWPGDDDDLVDSEMDATEDVTKDEMLNRLLEALIDYLEEDVGLNVR